MFDELPSRLPYHTSNAVMDHVPPRFPTKQIKTPIAIFYGGSDSLVDFSVLAADLPSPLAYVKAIERWEHLDFLWAEEIENVVYPDILKLLNHFNPLAKKINNDDQTVADTGVAMEPSQSNTTSDRSDVKQTA